MHTNVIRAKDTVFSQYLAYKDSCLVYLTLSNLHISYQISGCKDGSWNAREFAHNKGHILTNTETRPYYFFSEVLQVYSAS